MNRLRSAFPLLCVLALRTSGGVALNRGDFAFEYPDARPLPEARCRPMQWLDDTFVLSEGDPAVLVFSFALPADARPAAPRFLLALPETVRVTASHAGLVLESATPWEAGRRLHTFRLPPDPKDYAAEDDGLESPGMSVLVETDAPTGATLPDMVFWVRDDGRETPRSAMRLRVLPPVRARRPRHFAVGIMPRKPTSSLRGEGAERFGEFLRRAGIGWVIGTPNAPVTRSAMQSGLDVACEAGLANGFMLGWSMHPEDVAFRLATGDPVKRALCPTAIIARHPYVEEHLYEGRVRKLIAVDRTARHLTTNWEPYMFLGKGCFCTRCRAEFTRWSGLPPDEVAAEWPLELVKKRKELHERFFAWQHGRVLATLEAMCRQAGAEVGVESHFIPQVAYTLFDPAEKDKYYHRLTDPEQYAGEVPWLQPWGGYTTWDIAAPRRRPVGARLALLQGAAMARQWNAARSGDGPAAPRLSWGLGTSLGRSHCTFPEGVAFDILSCFLAGIDRTAAYVFPMGYDNRYWAAQARATETAAQFEGYVRDGRRIAHHALVPASPVPTVAAGSLLRSFEFERPEGRLVAVGNFWEEGEAFFRLSVTNLAPDARFELSEPLENRQYTAPSGETAWTADELVRGVLLHVGRLRWVFLTLRSAGQEPPEANLVRPEEMAAALEARLPALRRDHARTLALLAAEQEARTGAEGDYAALRPLESEGLRCSIEDLNGDGKPEVLFRRGDEELVIEPSRGARVLSWKFGAFDAVFPLGPHSLGVDATWAPAAFVDGEVQVLEHSLDPEGMRLVTERTFPASAIGCLPGLKATRTLLVPREGGSFRIATRLTNTSRTVQEFAYRQTAAPAALTRVTGGEGWVRLWGATGPFTFQRNFLKNRYHLAGVPKAERLDGYRMDVSGEVTEPRVRFGCSWSPVEIEARIEDDKLYALVFWDSGGQEASTAEFIGRSLKLKPGESWDITVGWHRADQDRAPAPAP